MSNNEVMKLEEDKDLKGEFKELCKALRNNHRINPNLYVEYDVKRGLRDINGKGALTGLTEISKIQSYTLVDCEMVPCDGKLYYHGVDIEDIVSGFIKEKRFGYEETLYLLLFGTLPTQVQLDQLNHLLEEYRSLPTSFVRDIIMKAPSKDMMNTLARSVLTLYAYDDRADDTSLPNVLRQCLQLTALVPLISVYGYQAYKHYHDGQSLFIHLPQPGLSTAENILYLLREDSKYTELEARILDLALVLSDSAAMDFSDVLDDRCTLEEATVRHRKYPKLSLLAAPLAPVGARFSQTAMQALGQAIRQQYDYCLIDAPAGLGEGFQLATAIADSVIVVTTTDPAALRDAQRTVMELRRFPAGQVHLVVNRVQKKMLKALHSTIDDAMDTAGLPLLGVIPEDGDIPLALNRGIPLRDMNYYAQRAYENIAKRITGARVPLMRARW